MVDFIGPRLSPRKGRLFALPCVRRVEQHLTDERSRAALAVAERYADGTASKKELKAAHVSAGEAEYEGANMAAYHLVSNKAIAGVCWEVVSYCLSDVQYFGGEEDWDARRREQYAQADLLRDIAGKLFRP